MKAMHSGTEVQAYILQKVADDAAFRERMVQDPKAAIEEATDGEMPEEMMVYIQQAIADTQAQEESPDAALSQAELAQVVGGVDCENDLNTEWYAECGYTRGGTGD